MNKEKNLVWIDLEMTGLNPQTDEIVEIATVITDSNLNTIAKGPHLVIHQSEQVLANMNPWVKEQHAKTGLTDASRASNISIQEAEQQTLAFIKQYCNKEMALLAGNSVWQDRAFMVKFMPDIIDYLHYRLLDVTAIKEVVLRWYPDDERAVFEKKEAHRAQDDIYESIEELKHYRKYFFV